MTAGDTIKAHSSIANNAVLTMQPGAGIEWLVQNLYMGGAWELYRTDGANTIMIDTGAQVGSKIRIGLIATNTIYYTLKNVSGGALYYGYDGLVIK